MRYLYFFGVLKPSPQFSIAWFTFILLANYQNVILVNVPKSNSSWSAQPHDSSWTLWKYLPATISLGRALEGHEARMVRMIFILYFMLYQLANYYSNSNVSSPHATQSKSGLSWRPANMGIPRPPYPRPASRVPRLECLKEWYDVHSGFLGCGLFVWIFPIRQPHWDILIRN